MKKTMVKKTSGRQRSVKHIKSKLMAAISMLMVSTIMLMSSTYAWFTLSTAPEVTGISTSVGANGALEIALMPAAGAADQIGANVGDGAEGKPVVESNTTWGNLVELADPAYGLDKITLYPSQLNMIGDKINLGSILGFPRYGADGRVSELAGALTARYDSANKNFDVNSAASSGFGVRAVGAASGMTDRQIAFRTAKNLAYSSMGQAKTAAAASLTTNGKALANLAIKHVSSESATFNWDEIKPVKDMLTALDSSLDYIEVAYAQYILAFTASAATQNVQVEGEGEESGTTIDLEIWTVFEDEIEKGASLEDLQAKITSYGAAVPSELSNMLSTGITKLRDAQADLAAAVSKMPTETTVGKTTGKAGEFTWEDFNAALTGLVNINQLTIQDHTIDEIKENKELLILPATKGETLVMKMPTGSGVFADIADQTGDYSANLKNFTVNPADMGYESLDMDISLNVSMKTGTTVKPAYLSLLDTGATEAGAPSSGGASQPFSEFYGYIIDLAFRTNAAASDLLLQTTPIDRIYKDKTDMESETMGHGSTMVFTAAEDLDVDDITKLLGNLRVVFFEPAGSEGAGAVYATGKLNLDPNKTKQVEVTDGGVTTMQTQYTANIVLSVNADENNISKYAWTADATPDDGQDAVGATFTVADGYDLASVTVGTVAISLNNLTDNGNGSYSIPTSLAPAVASGADVVTVVVTKAAAAEKTGSTTWSTTTGCSITIDSGYALKSLTIGGTAVDLTKGSATNGIYTILASALKDEAYATEGATVAYVLQKADDTSAKIMPLSQGVATPLSVLVYLDGTTISNADVSATGLKSLNGVLNLQFASSAALVPMQYGELSESTGTSTEEGDEDATTYTVTLPQDGSVTGATSAPAGADYKFTVNTTKTLDTVTVGGNPVSPTDGGNGEYTIPAASVTGDIVITTK